MGEQDIRPASWHFTAVQQVWAMDDWSASTSLARKGNNSNRDLKNCFLFSSGYVLWGLYGEIFARSWRLPRSQRVSVGTLDTAWEWSEFLFHSHYILYCLGSPVLQQPLIFLHYLKINGNGNLPIPLFIAFRLCRMARGPLAPAVMHGSKLTIMEKCLHQRTSLNQSINHSG